MSIPQMIRTEELEEHESRYSIKLNEGTTVIAKNQFEGYSLLEEVFVPSSVKKIEKFAFYQCNGLKRISLPDSITEIEENAFDQCSELGYVKLPAGIVELKKFTFRYCNSLTHIDIPSSVKKISNLAFYGCGNLSDVFYDSIKHLVYDDLSISESKSNYRNPQEEIIFYRKMQDKIKINELCPQTSTHRTIRKKRSEALREYLPKGSKE